MAARIAAILFLVGLLVGASTLQQVIDLQSDEIGVSLSFDDLDPPLVCSAAPPPSPSQEVAIEWPADSPIIRTHTLTIFRPPRLAASR